MANTLAPAITGTYDGEMVWRMTDYTVSDAMVKYIDSMEVVHRPRFVVKMTGFESTKHIFAPTSGTDVLADISLTLTGDMPHWLCERLRRLAQGCFGAGMELDFRDDFWESRLYSCRWVNAGDFVENSALLAAATIQLQAWDYTEL